jgi:hypothetical protein
VKATQWEDRRWTMDDDQRLRQLYKEHVDRRALDILANRLARTTEGLHKRAIQIGLAPKPVKQEKVGTAPTDAAIKAGKDFAAGWREVGPQRCYFRSKWEANYARYLQWLVSQKIILGWAHEPKTFWFEGIRRGVVSYKPDFKVVEKDGTYAWHEVKGYMDHRSKMTLKRMAKFHPHETIVLIDKTAYRAIEAKAAQLVEGWE